MGKIKAEDPKEFVKLEKEVSNYIKNNPYPGFEKGFALEKLVLAPSDGTARLAHVHLTDSNLRIDKLDRTWLKNLASVGESYGVRVVLNERIYLR